MGCCRVGVCGEGVGFMKLKNRQIILLVAVLILVVLVASVAVVLNMGNGDAVAEDGVNGGTSEDGNGNDDAAESGDWIDLDSNLDGVATDCRDGFRHYLDVCFINENEGWVTASIVAEIYHTTDGGETWEVQTTQLPCNAICMLNENEGYAGGDSGFVYHTTDGGATWNYHGTITHTLADISFSSQSSVGFACGLESASAQISPEGVTLLERITVGVLDGVSATASNEAWFCGGSLLLHYLDGNYVSNDYPSGGYLAICMINNKEGWAVGDNGIIIHTTDGQNWAKQTNPTTRTLNDMFFIDADEGWAVGLDGTIIHTTDGGTTWTVEGEEPTTSFLTGVCFPSSSVGYVCGHDGTLLKYVGEN
jgi:photosystem II stability/assembly factor-like uncharacterized protein